MNKNERKPKETQRKIIIRELGPSQAGAGASPAGAGAVPANVFDGVRHSRPVILIANNQENLLDPALQAKAPGFGFLRRKTA